MQHFDIIPDGKDGYRSSRRVVYDYYYDPEIGATVIPSRASKSGVGMVDTSGKQMNNFDPHTVGPQIIDPHLPGAIGGGMIWDPSTQEYPLNAEEAVRLGKDEDREDAIIEKGMKNMSSYQPKPKNLVDPATIKQKTTSPEPAPNQTSTVYMHVPGMKLPYEFNEVLIEPDKNSVVLVSDTQQIKKLPSFEQTSEDDYIVLSTDEHPNILFCQYFNQTFVIGGRIHIVVLVLVTEQSKG